MAFEINVSLNGRHLFATHKRSIKSVFDVPNVYRIIKEKFPPSEGFEISLSEKPEIYYGADMRKVDEAITQNNIEALCQLFKT